MIFGGDTVFPGNYDGRFIDSLPDEFVCSKKILNLESQIVKNINLRKLTKGIALHSSTDIFSFLNDMFVESVSLSNNHITDFDQPVKDQIDLLQKNGIGAFGAGSDLYSASKPYIYHECGNEYIVCSFGWDVIGCKYALESSQGVNPMEYKHVFKQVLSIKQEKTDAYIVLIFHTNYEFELYPQPAHRKMFFDLIDIGVDAIFCHHPHIVSGCEVYNKSPIFYSLGNFYLPEANYNGFNLKYIDDAKVGLCVNYGVNREIELYWTYKDDLDFLTITKHELLCDSSTIKYLTPFDGMEHSDYVKWFSKNRKKRKLLPIYKNYSGFIEGMLNGYIVKSRQKIIDARLRLRG